MNDAIALLAISQLVSLGATIYLYTQVQTLRSRTVTRRAPSQRAQTIDSTVELGAGAGRAARQAYAAQATGARRPVERRDGNDLVARLGEMGMDIPALARRMHKSEEEVRLLLRRQGMARQ